MDSATATTNPSRAGVAPVRAAMTECSARPQCVPSSPADPRFSSADAADEGRRPVTAGAAGAATNLSCAAKPTWTAAGQRPATPAAESRGHTRIDDLHARNRQRTGTLTMTGKVEQDQVRGAVTVAGFQVS